MRIKCIQIKNFRSILNTTLDCDSLTAIVGRNGAGKSAILHAINKFYDLSAQISLEDYFSKEPTNAIEIRITFHNLREDELEEFASYIQSGDLTITKKIHNADGRITQKYFGSSLQIPQFAEIRKIAGKTDQRDAFNELVNNATITGLSGTVRSADAAELRMNEFESQHQELRQYVESEVQFLGPKNVGGGKIDKYTKLVFVPAVRELTDEVGGKKGAIQQLIDAIVYTKVNARRDVKEFKERFEVEAKRVYASDNLKELPALGEAISETLDRFAPGAKLNLKWGEVAVPEVKLPETIPSLTEDGFEGDIRYKGHGLQRALILSLLQYLATSTKGDVQEGEEPVEPNLILLIEEPELYLHPSRSRYLSQLFLDLIKPPHNVQIIYATHSPFFIDLQRFDQIRLVRKIKEPEITAAFSDIAKFSLREASQELARISGKNPLEFTRESFKARSSSVISTIVNEGFFADVVVLVEGLTELGMLWKLQEIKNKEWPKYGVVVVPALGKNNLDRPLVIFKGLKIPTYMIFDGDKNMQGTGDEEKHSKTNKSYLKLMGTAEVDFPPTQSHANWAVFEVNIEEEIKKALGEVKYAAYRQKVMDELGCDLKNLEASSRFIELIYGGGDRIEVLEDAVDAITSLRVPSSNVSAER